MPGYPSLWRLHLHGDLWVELCSEMQSSADRAGSDMRGLHVEGKYLHNSRARIAAFPDEMGGDGQFAAEICPGLVGGERVGFESLLGSTSSIPELCVVAKNEMGTTEDIIRGGAETADGKSV